MRFSALLLITLVPLAATAQEARREQSPVAPPGPAAPTPPEDAGEEGDAAREDDDEASESEATPPNGESEPPATEEPDEDGANAVPSGEGADDEAAGGEPEPIAPEGGTSGGAAGTPDRPEGPAVGESPFAPLRRAPIEERREIQKAASVPDSAAATQATEASVQARAATRPARPRSREKSLYGSSETRFELRLDGYLRGELSCIYPTSFCGIGTPSDEDARRNPFVGRNDGFAVSGARLNVRGRYGEDLYVRVALEGAASSMQDAFDPQGRYATQIGDAYLSYRLTEGIELHAGRFRPPFDAQSLTPLEQLFFVHRALESRGVRAQEGWPSTGLGAFSPGRQVGAMLSGEHDVGDPGRRLRYFLAVTNGNAGQWTLNDNDRFAAYGRVSFELRDSERFADYHRGDEEGPATIWLEEGLRVGLGGYFNELTSGEPPNRFDDRVYGVGADFAARYSFFVARGQVLLRQVQQLTRGGSADERGVGGHLQLAVDVLRSGFFPAYRFALLDARDPLTEPTAIETADNDQVTHHTLGVKWISKSLPVMAWFEYTVSLEEEGRELPNDRFELGLQVIFE